MNGQSPLLSICLSVDYPGKPAVLRNARFDVARGEILGLVGESGSGKSTLALAILNLLGYRGADVSGEVHFQGRDLARLSDHEMRPVRGRQIGFVPQSPLTSLNPALRIGTHLDEAWTAHANGRRNARRANFLSLLESVSLPSEEPFLKRFPRELSVGQAQRLLIAMAILHKPALVIADEPTSALDVVTQAEILKLFKRLNQGLDMAVLYISHDLLSVTSLCHRVAILHDGEIVEAGPTERIFREPQHPYTQRLIQAMPKSPL
ncbi:MAG TPA: ATP-binding cassette domain-containing protein [Bryobacteraceae bacterium]|nr:ATP-binding cassette domain-containing protein [Bryobacteraceae bacterium]